MTDTPAADVLCDVGVVLGEEMSDEDVSQDVMSAEAFDPRRTALGYQAVVSTPLAGEDAGEGEAKPKPPRPSSTIIPELYRVRTDHGEVGPVPLALIERGFALGRIPEDAEICRVGEQAWKPIHLVIDTTPPPAPVVVSRVVAIERPVPPAPPTPASPLQQLKSTVVMPLVDPEAEPPGDGSVTADAIAWSPQADLPPGSVPPPALDLAPPSLPVGIPPMNPIIGVLTPKRSPWGVTALAVGIVTALAVCVWVLATQLG